MSDIKVLAWGVMTKQGLVDVSTDREDTVEAQRYAKTCPIVELVDKAAADKQSKRIQELESAIREFLSWTCYKDDEPDYIDALNNPRNLVSDKND